MKRFISNSWVRATLLVLLALGLPACGKNSTQSDLIPATIVYFQEQEPGIDPYPVRMIVTHHYLRIDSGVDQDDFLLFDRKAKTIHSSNGMDQSILVMTPYAQSQQKSTEQPPPQILVREQSTAGMPSYGNTRPIHKTVMVGEKTCKEAISVPGMLPEVVAAVREYLQTLAAQQRLLLKRTPKEMRDPCMLANIVFFPDRYLDAGFPLREWDYQGLVREIVDFETQSVSPELFEFPQGYTEIQVQQ